MASYWTPHGATVPTLAELIAGIPVAVTPDPAFPWNPASGQHVVTRDGQNAYWDGATWVAYGPATGASPGNGWTPYGATLPATLADLIAGIPVTVTPDPADPWDAGWYVTTRDGVNACWDGAAWVASGPATGASPYNQWTPYGATPPATVADLIAGIPVAITPDPADPWDPEAGVFTTTRDGVNAYWDGAAWVASGPATGASSGSWTPYWATPPATVADLIAGIPVTVTPDSADPWGYRSYVTTRDGMPVYWDGAAWVIGFRSGPATGVDVYKEYDHWTPYGATPPATVADLIAGIPVTVTPATTDRWGFGWWLTTRDGMPFYWNGTAWVAGENNTATGVSPSSWEFPDGHWTPYGATAPTLADLIAVPVTVTPTPNSAWTTDDHVVTRDGQNAYWDGAAWVASGPATGANWNGYFVPPGATRPATVADLIAGIPVTVTPALTDPWDPANGQLVVTGDGQNVYWDGAAWVATGPATTAAPWTWLPRGATAPTLADLIAGVPVTVTPEPTDPWDPATQIIGTRDRHDVYWDGAAWVARPQ